MKKPPWIPYPGVDYPTIIEGEIWGPVRCESLDGSEMYLESPDPVTIFKNFQPFEQNGKMWGVSQIQKKSKRGWLKIDPNGYFAWWTWHLPERDAQGGWKPGTESGIYLRRPLSWRWDVPGTFEDGALRHFIFSYGYLGRHYD